MSKQFPNHHSIRYSRHRLQMQPGLLRHSGRLL
jgi:hypothetical protein